MENDKISVIIPVYNTKIELIERCVQSIQQQTYRNLEIIMVNDGSTYLPTAAYLNNVAAADKRVCVLEQNNQGASVARRTGVLAATGTYLLFVDSDDAIHVRTCEYLLGLMKGKEYDIAEASGREIYHLAQSDLTEKLDTAVEYTIEGRENLLDALVQNCELPLGWAAWGKLYKTDTMKRCYKAHAGIYRGEDVLTVAEYLLESQKIVVSNQKLYYYNKGNPDSATAQKSIKNLSLCKYGYELLQIYQKHGSEEAYSHVRAMYCEILFGSLLLCEYNRYQDYKHIKKQIRAELMKYRKDILINPFVHKRWKLVTALICPGLFYIQHIIREKIKS